MNPEQFISALKVAVVDSANNSVFSLLSHPPGRKPAEKLIEMSTWFNNLSRKDMEMVQRIINESIESAVFGFLCVLDGVRAIENDENKGELLLFFQKDGERIQLNDPTGGDLHELFWNKD